MNMINDFEIPKYGYGAGKALYPPPTTTLAGWTFHTC